MPGPMLQSTAMVNCVHAGKATPTAVNPRVTLTNVPIVLQPTPYAIAGCTFPVMSSGSPPCVTAQFTTASIRVTSMGQPVLLQDSQATCAPNGTPVLISTNQIRVTAM